MSTLEDQVKAKLGIKYTAAKQLIAEAKANLEITDDGEERKDEIIDEVTQIFEDDLMPEEQEEMRVSGQVKSDFKQRALAAAQRREAAERHVEQPQQPQGQEEEIVEEYEEPVGEEVEMQEEVIEDVVQQEGEYEEGAGGETVTETVTTQVAEDGTQTITKKTVTKKVVEESGGTKVVVCCTIL